MVETKLIKLKGQRLTYLNKPDVEQLPDRYCINWSLYEKGAVKGNTDGRKCLLEGESEYGVEGEWQRNVQEEIDHLLDVAAAILGISYKESYEIANNHYAMSALSVFEDAVGQLSLEEERGDEK